MWLTLWRHEVWPRLSDKVCPDCNGIGTTGDEESFCTYCDGEGVVGMGYSDWDVKDVIS